MLLLLRSCHILDLSLPPLPSPPCLGDIQRVQNISSHLCHVVSLSHGAGRHQPALGGPGCLPSCSGARLSPPPQTCSRSAYSASRLAGFGTLTTVYRPVRRSQAAGVCSAPPGPLRGPFFERRGQALFTDEGAVCSRRALASLRITWAKSRCFVEMQHVSQVVFPLRRRCASSRGNLSGFISVDRRHHQICQSVRCSRRFGMKHVVISPNFEGRLPKTTTKNALHSKESAMRRKRHVIFGSELDNSSLPTLRAKLHALDIESITTN